MNDAAEPRHLLPWPVRLVVSLFTRLLTGLVVSAIIFSGLYFYLTKDPELKQKVFSTVMGQLQDVCSQMNESGVDLGEMNYRSLDLGGIAKTMVSDAAPEEKQRQLQQIGQSLASSNESVLKEALMAQGVSSEDATKALAFQPVMTKYSIPLPLGPFAFAIKDRPNAERFFTSFHIKNVGPQGAGAIPLLKDALASSDQSLRQAATQSLTLIGTPEAKAALQAPR